ncbi:hypothetical protein SAMD00023353_3901160 [Rosellinia necatrix]|uniref:Uncharacterized protein n=1 Tax=Rosellinia necatrix TaxID=77044 RepID=A0A1S7UNP9_ROSNE|nr:hypothetical protein SAMD00023353_3901160 [Rosellinia necatrix]
MNISECASGPHDLRGTSAERDSMQKYRVSNAMQQGNEHVTQRLVDPSTQTSQTFLAAHEQELKTQVDSISLILAPGVSQNSSN